MEFINNALYLPICTAKTNNLNRSRSAATAKTPNLEVDSSARRLAREGSLFCSLIGEGFHSTYSTFFFMTYGYFVASAVVYLYGAATPLVAQANVYRYRRQSFIESSNVEHSATSATNFIRWRSQKALQRNKFPPHEIRSDCFFYIKNP